MTWAMAVYFLCIEAVKRLKPWGWLSEHDTVNMIEWKKTQEMC